MNPMLTPTAYLPIEESHRELDARILLAIHLLQKGVSVVIGQQWLFGHNFMNFPRGIIVQKGLSNIQVEHGEIFRRNGFLCTAVDEEVLALGDKEYAGRDISPSAGDYCREIFAQGQFHKEAILEHVTNKNVSISITGNGRLDLLSKPFQPAFQESVGKIREELGEFVLFNSNLVFHNSNFNWDNYYKLLERMGWLRGRPEEDALLQEMIAWDRINYDVTTETLRHLAGRNPDQRFVLRPHPMEKADAWMEEFVDLPNVTVHRGGDHISMILASQLMLHTGCTTGLEARMLGKPALALRPADVTSDSWRCFLSYFINPCSIGADDAAAQVEAHLSGERPLDIVQRATGNDRMARHIGNLHGDSASALIAERMTALLEHHLTQSGRYSLGAPFDWSENLLGPIAESIARTPRDQRKCQIERAYFLERVQAISNTIGVERSFGGRQIGEGLFLLAPK